MLATRVITAIPLSSDPSVIMQAVIDAHLPFGLSAASHTNNSASRGVPQNPAGSAFIRTCGQLVRVVHSACG